jgi:hypothetical protein
VEISPKTIREILKGIVRCCCTCFFGKNVLDNKKITLRRHKQSGVLGVTNTYGHGFAALLKRKYFQECKIYFLRKYI